MTAIFSDSDARVLVALFGVLAAFAAAGWRQSHRAVKEMKPNGGASMRDVVDRIEANQQQMRALVETQVIPRLDASAIAISNHADRLAIIENRDLIVSLVERVDRIENPTRKRKVASNGS